MESRSTSNFYITYPSSPAYAFNRNILRLSSVSDSKLIIKVGTLAEDVREVHNSSLDIDISRYLQLNFSRGELANGTTNKSISVQILGAENRQTYFSTTIDTWWGAIGAGEQLGDTEEDIFDGEIYFFAVKGASITIQAQGGSPRTITSSASATGTMRISLSSYGLSGASVVIVKQTLNASVGTFSDNFDYTFIYNNIGAMQGTYNINPCAQGTFLRWVDNFGVWHSRYFVEGSENISTADYGAEIDDYNMKTDAEGFYNVNWKQGHTSNAEAELCVPLANKAMWRVLRTIISSPLVYYRAEDGNFYPVNVKANTYTRSKSHSEDFIITIQKPQITTQIL